MCEIFKNLRNFHFLIRTGINETSLTFYQRTEKNYLTELFFKNQWEATIGLCLSYRL